MGILASIQSQSNVASSKTYITNQLLDESDITQVKQEMSASKNGKYSRSLGAFVEEKMCSLEKAKSYSIKASINKMKGSKTFTIFCNVDSTEEVLKQHSNAIATQTINEALIKAAQDI